MPVFLSYLNNMLLFKILQELVSFFPWVTRKCESTQVRGTLRSLIPSFPRPDHSPAKPPGPNHQSCELTKLFSHLASSKFYALVHLDRLPPLSRCPGLRLGKLLCGNFIQGSHHLYESFPQKRVRAPMAIFPLVYRTKGDAHFMRQLFLGKTHALAAGL